MPITRTTAEELKAASTGPSITPTTSEELEYSQPANVSQQQGVSYFERLALNVLANDPEKAKFWLRKRGFEVSEYGQPGDFNFAVRKDPTEPWKVVDPAGFDLQDILADILPEFAIGAITELGRTAGGALGFFGGSAAPGAGNVGGGLLGQSLGAGATGAVEDVLLQELGVLVGVNEKIDPLRTAIVGTASAALPGMGRIASRAIRNPVARRFAGDIAKSTLKKLEPVTRNIGKSARGAVSEGTEILAKFAGFPEEFGLAAKESLVRTAQRLPLITHSLKDAVDITRGLTKKISSRKFGETVALEKMLKKTSINPYIDVTDEITALAHIDPTKALTEEAERRLRSVRREILDTVALSNPVTIKSLLETAGTPTGLVDATGTLFPVKPIIRESKEAITGMSGRRIMTRRAEGAVRTLEPIRVDIGTALQLKRLFGDISADAGIFSGAAKKTKKSAERRIANAFSSVRRKLKDNLPAQYHNYFEALNKGIQRKTVALKGITRFVGRGTDDDLVLRGLELPEKVSPESFFKNARGELSQSRLAAIDLFDEVFEKDLRSLFAGAVRGTPAESLFRRRLIKPKISDLAVESRIGSAFGKDTKPGFIPPLGATGAVKSAAAFGSIFGGLGLGSELLSEETRSPGERGLIGAGSAAAGAALGFSLASPRILAGLTRKIGIQKIPQKWTKDKVNKVFSALLRASGNPKLTSAGRASAFAFLQAKLKEMSAKERSTVK